MSTEIIQHGLRWINNGKQIQCPECNHNGYSKKAFIPIEKDKKINEYSATLCCNNCLCEWSISRTEKIKKNDK